MIGTVLDPTTDVGEILCIGAHPDDIEIGGGATVRRLVRTYPHATFRWVVLSSTPERAAEAEASAAFFLSEAAKSDVRVADFRESYFPWAGAQLKDWFEELKLEVDPDVVLTHFRHDLHQDHRVVSELTWNTFRRHLVLEYEIPKYDGDLHTPNTFVPIERSELEEKIDALERYFRTQRTKAWFNRNTFMALPSLRGVECDSPTGFAEAFHVRKNTLDLVPASPEGATR